MFGGGGGGGGGAGGGESGGLFAFLQKTAKQPATAADSDSVGAQNIRLTVPMSDVCFILFQLVQSNFVLFCTYAVDLKDHFQYIVLTILVSRPAAASSFRLPGVSHMPHNVLRAPADTQTVLSVVTFLATRSLTPEIQVISKLYHKSVQWPASKMRSTL